IVSLKPPNLEFGGRYLTPIQLFKRSEITKMWQRRQISNFDYLMKLNTFAGRTYNDLCQYPVFPWIIADYTSKTLNFDDPKTFRKLHLPMGVQKEEKIAIMQEKYKMSHSEDMPGFHWGS